MTSGWCDKHQSSTTSKQYDRWRGSSTQRGYDYEWGQFRDALLKDKDFALCRDCLDIGIIHVTEQLHHIKKVAEFPHMKLDRNNIMPLCGMHHSRRTAKGE